MTCRIAPMIRSLALLLAVAAISAGCVAYPAGPYGYRPGWRGSAPYHAQAHRPQWGDGWGHHRRW